MIRFITLLTFVLYTATPSTAQDLVISVEKIRESKGDILLALYANPEGFPFDAAKAIGRYKSTPSGGTAAFRLKAIPRGRYAIALFQDSNGDGKLNTNFLGIPQEGYGVSNNAYRRFSAPEFGASAFWHEELTTLHISMKY